jgi:hypothetical protein
VSDLVSWSQIDNPSLDQSSISWLPEHSHVKDRISKGLSTLQANADTVKQHERKINQLRASIEKEVRRS